MLAARAYEGDTELRLEEVDPPAVGAGDVLVKVEAAGLAPGMLELWARGLFPVLPKTLGHEAAGTVAELGSGTTGVAVGDRVRLHPNLTCKRCEYCLTDREPFCRACSMIGHGMFGPEARPLHERYLHGALAEYLLAPAWALDPLPSSISFDAAAKVHDVANALRALRVAAPRPGATVVLTAATGTVGTSAVRLAPMFGVARLIAVARSAERLEQVQALAPDLITTVALEELGEDWGEAQGLTGAIRELAPAGADALIDLLPEGAGSWQAIASLKTAGTAVVMGSNLAMPPMPTMAIMTNAWRILGNRNCTRDDARQILRWLDDGLLEVDDLITHRFDLSDIAQATRTVRERPEPTWMVVIHPGSPS